MKYGKYLINYTNSLKDKNIIVTGANAGLGFECSRYILFLGGNLIMACRNLEKATLAKEELLKEFPSSKIDIVVYDQASFISIYEAYNDISKYDHIDGVICNAGIYYPKKSMKTKDDFELTIGTNYLGLSYFLDLMETILINNQTKVIVVNSLTAYLSKSVSVEYAQKLSRNKVYGTSKLFLSEETFDRMEENKYPLVLAHPGITATNILSSKDTGLSSTFALLGRKFLNIFTHSAEKAALSLVIGLVCEYKPLMYIKPRGLFAISGYPKIKKMPKKFRNKNRLNTTRLFTQKVGQNVISK